jgi:hypothetical protein
MQPIVTQAKRLGKLAGEVNVGFQSSDCMLLRHPTNQGPLFSEEKAAAKQAPNNRTSATTRTPSLGSQACWPLHEMASVKR